MKFVDPSGFTDPDTAARKLVDIANAVEAVQDEADNKASCAALKAIGGTI